jgi:uncharacterized protein YhbP (UPF0306 family)
MSRLSFTAIHAQDVAGRAIELSTALEERVSESIFRVLEGSELCSIATVTPEGHPHINTAYFSYSPDLELYFVSHPSSQHSRNLSGHPSMAMAVFSSAQQWTEPDLGLQLFGSCEEARGPAARQAEKSYARRFQAYTSWKAMLKNDDLARQYRFYRFGVTAVKILDEKNLGDAVLVLASVARR